MKPVFTDEQLVTQLSESSKTAFEEIYNRYWYKLFCMSFHQTGSREEAEELVHDLFESLWDRRAVSNIKHLSSYLIISLKYLITNHIKSRITWRKYQEYVLLNKMHEISTTEENIQFNDLSEAIDRAMKKLPEKTSRVFQLSRFENQSVKNIAQELRISEKAVEYHITRSLKYLKDTLGIYHTDN
jgi:RNA polymerase sigma-70 factor (family 1)